MKIRTMSFLSYGLPVSMFESVLKQVSDCFKEKTDLVQRFKMTGSDGVTAEFGFIPNLDKMSFGEYIDLESYITDWDNMHKAMAVMYRPIVAGKNHLYEIEPYQGTERWEEVMKDAPVNEEEKTGNTVLKLALEESGVGINQYMDSLEVMSSSLTQLPKFHYTPA